MFIDSSLVFICPDKLMHILIHEIWVIGDRYPKQIVVFCDKHSKINQLNLWWQKNNRNDKCSLWRNWNQRIIYNFSCQIINHLSSRFFFPFFACLELSFCFCLVLFVSFLLIDCRLSYLAFSLCFYQNSHLCSVAPQIRVERLSGLNMSWFIPPEALLSVSAAVFTGDRLIESIKNQFLIQRWQKGASSVKFKTGLMLTVSWHANCQITDMLTK